MDMSYTFQNDGSMFSCNVRWPDQASMSLKDPAGNTISAALGFSYQADHRWVAYFFYGIPKGSKLEFHPYMNNGSCTIYEAS